MMNKCRVGVSRFCLIFLTVCVVIEVGFTQTVYSVSEAAGSFSDVALSILVPTDPAAQLVASVVISLILTIVSGSAVGKSICLFICLSFLATYLLSLQKASTSV